MLEWTPIIFFTFKLVVLGIGMFYAIKWHYDQGKKHRQTDKRALLRATGAIAVIFVLALLALLLITYIVSKALGLDMTLP